MSPERRYRMLLLAYPRAYRAERAQEMLDVLLATEERRGRRSGMSEGLSLVGHGLAQRMRRPSLRPEVSPSVGLAGASLLCLLAVLGTQQLLAAGLRGLGVDGYPDAWGIGVLWVDPRWPVQALWLVSGLALLSGRHRLVVGSAWAAAVLHLWHLVVTASTTVELPWPGDVGPHWIATSGVAQAGWALLSVSGAVMIGSPTRSVRARAGLPLRRWWAVAATGLVGSALALLSAPAVYAVLGNGRLHLVEGVRGPVLPLVLAAAVLASGLWRARDGRAALLILGVLAAAPLAARWSEPMGVIAAGAVLFAAGYAAAARSRRVDASSVS